MFKSKQEIIDALNRMMIVFLGNLDQRVIEIDGELEYRDSDGNWHLLKEEQIKQCEYTSFEKFEEYEQEQERHNFAKQLGYHLN